MHASASACPNLPLRSCGSRAQNGHGSCAAQPYMRACCMHDMHDMQDMHAMHAHQDLNLDRHLTIPPALRPPPLPCPLPPALSRRRPLWPGLRAGAGHPRPGLPHLPAALAALDGGWCDRGILGGGVMECLRHTGRAALATLGSGRCAGGGLRACVRLGSAAGRAFLQPAHSVELK